MKKTKQNNTLIKKKYIPNISAPRSGPFLNEKKTTKRKEKQFFFFNNTHKKRQLNARKENK